MPWLVLIALEVTLAVILMLAVMSLVAGWRADDVRSVVLHYAYLSFTYEGERIPGCRPGVVARCVIRHLSDPADRRLDLVPELRLRPRDVRSPARPFDRMAIEDYRRRLCDAAFRAH